MNDPFVMPSASLYAVKLHAVDPSDRGRIAGRLEHVLSGRLHDFEDGAALLRLLVREQSQAYSIDLADLSATPGADLR